MILAMTPRVNPILDRIVATAELTDATARTVQRIAADLRPGVLDKLGLPMALQYEAAPHGRAHRPPVRSRAARRGAAHGI
jgi:signal transduction histidine kinase